MMLLAAPGQTVPRHDEDRRTGPMRPRNRLASYEERLDCLWQRLVATLGIHTARVLLARAVWQTAQRHPDIVLIRHDNCGLSFDALEMSYVTWPQEEVGEYAIGPQEEVGEYAIGPQEDIEAALSDLSAEIVRILARLRGGEKAQRMGTGHPGSRQAGMYRG